MEDNDFEEEDLEFQQEVEDLKAQHRLNGYFMLFKHWNNYGKDAPKRIYLYFKDNHNLQKMQELFEEIEEYEKCAVIRDWLIEIAKIEKKDKSRYLK